MKLRGVRSNRAGVGARIRVEMADGGSTGSRRSVVRYVGTGGSFGANPLMQHIGLGKSTRIEVLEVYWPATGRKQVLRDLPADRAIEITEDEPGYRSLPNVPFLFQR